MAGNTFQWWFYDVLEESDDDSHELNQAQVDEAVEHDEFLHPMWGDPVSNFKTVIHRTEVDGTGRLLRRITLQQYLTGLEGL